MAVGVVTCKISLCEPKEMVHAKAAGKDVLYLALPVLRIAVGVEQALRRGEQRAAPVGFDAAAFEAEIEAIGVRAAEDMPTVKNRAIDGIVETALVPACGHVSCTPLCGYHSGRSVRRVSVTSGSTLPSTKLRKSGYAPGTVAFGGNVKRAIIMCLIY